MNSVASIYGGGRGGGNSRGGGRRFSYKGDKVSSPPDSPSYHELSVSGALIIPLGFSSLSSLVTSWSLPGHGPSAPLSEVQQACGDDRSSGVGLRGDAQCRDGFRGG